MKFCIYYANRLNFYTITVKGLPSFFAAKALFIKKNVARRIFQLILIKFLPNNIQFVENLSPDT